MTCCRPAGTRHGPARPAGVFDLLKDTEYIGGGQFPHGPDFYQRAPKLRIIQTLSAGYNTYDFDAARVVVGVPICNNGGANSTAVAEHAMMLMLAVSRKLICSTEGVPDAGAERLQRDQATSGRQDPRDHRPR